VTAHVFIVGFMGAGKSTVGPLVAEGLSLPFVDLDRRLEEAFGKPIPAVFEEDGEESFRRAESEELAAVVSGPACVVACGGGIVLDPANRDVMARAGVVVYLAVSEKEALDRVGAGSGRPLLGDDPDRAVRELMEARRSLYEEAADVVVDTTDADPARVAESVLGLVETRVG
jgi:shikimate kinase